MKHTYLFLFSFFVFGSLSSFLCNVAKAQEEKKAVKPLEEYIKDLNNDDYQVRKAATQFIWNLEKNKIEELYKKYQKADPEIIYRLHAIYTKVRLGLFPSTSKEIVEAVQAVMKTNVYKEAENGIARLEEINAKEQIIYLYSIHTNPRIKRLLLKTATNLLPELVIELLNKNELNRAENILKIMPQNFFTVNCLGAIYQYEGKVETVIEELKKTKQGRKSPLLFTLYQTQQNLEGMRQWAINTNNDLKLAQVEMLSGNPQPFIEKIRQARYLSSRYKQTKQQHLGYDIAIALYEGDLSSAKIKLKKLTAQLEKQNISAALTNRILPAVACGDVSALDKEFGRFYDVLDNKRFKTFENYTVSATKHYLLLNYIGVPQSRQLISQWAKQQAHKAETANPERPFFGKGGRFIRNILAAATMYHSCEDHKAVEEIINPLFWQTYKKSQTAHKNLVKELVQQDYLPYLIKQSQQYRKEDQEELYEEIINRLNITHKDALLDAIMGDKETIDFETITSLLNVTGHLRGRHAMKPKELKALNAKIMQSLKDWNENDKSEMEHFLTLHQGDIHHYYKLMDKLRNKEIFNPSEETYFYISYSLGYWDKVVSCLESYDKKSLNFYHYTIWSIALRKLNPKNDPIKAAEAKEKLKLAFLYSLHSSASLQHIAELHTHYGLYDEAATVYSKLLTSNAFDSRRSLLETSNKFSNLIHKINTEHFLFIKLKQWEKASSIAAVGRALCIYKSNSLLNLNVSLRSYINTSNQADFTRAMVLMETEPKAASALLLRCAKSASGGGMLAEYFFPTLREKGMHAIHRRCYQPIAQNLRRSIKKFPLAANTRNSFAWLSARSLYNLDEAITLSQESLKLAPFTPAYEDTLAEIYFALGHRKTAIIHSKNALNLITTGQSHFRYNLQVALRLHQDLFKQLKRFQHAPLPQKN